MWSPVNRMFLMLCFILVDMTPKLNGRCQPTEEHRLQCKYRFLAIANVPTQIISLKRTEPRVCLCLFKRASVCFPSKVHTL